MPDPISQRLHDAGGQCHGRPDEWRQFPRPLLPPSGRVALRRLSSGQDSPGAAVAGGQTIDVLLEVRLHLVLRFTHKPQAPAVAGQSRQGSMANEPAYQSGFRNWSMPSSFSRDSHQAR
jgi:hypothetical protein